LLQTSSSFHTRETYTPALAAHQHLQVHHTSHSIRFEAVEPSGVQALKNPKPFEGY